MRGKQVWLDFFFLSICYICPYILSTLLLCEVIFSEMSVSNADEPLPFYEVLVGVLSARHHYELRQAIRETWLGYLRHHPHFQHRSAGWTFNFTAFLFVLICLAFLFLTMSNSYSREKGRGGWSQQQLAANNWQPHQAFYLYLTSGQYCSLSFFLFVHFLLIERSEHR